MPAGGIGLADARLGQSASCMEGLVIEMNAESGGQDDQLSEAAAELTLLISEFSAFDKPRRHVAFDRLWSAPDGLRQLALILERFISVVLPGLDPQRAVLLAPDTLSFTYGIAPAACIVADRLGLRFALWKEFGDVAWGRPLVFGTEEEDLNCVVIQDVILTGTTILKIGASLAERRWRVAAYLSLISAASPGQVEEMLGRLNESTGGKEEIVHRCLLPMATLMR